MTPRAPAWYRTAASARFHIHLVILARAIMAGLLPLSADEAYYWLWSKHLDLGYFDHPPAIAWLIRLGTALFGDTAFGVRAAGIVLSGLTTLFVWEAARTILKDERRALVAALLFNLTLMIGVEMLAATPDMPSIATSAAFLFCLAKLERTGRARWWLWAGVAEGLGLLSKYSALFLIAGAFLWLVIPSRTSPADGDAPRRAWLKTPWPWAGFGLALLIFLPNLLWQQTHGWETFAFQFGRIEAGHLTGRFLLEFLGAQLGLASPFLFVMGVAGLVRARPGQPLFLPAMLIWPAVLYFLVHALHDRVQGNWPCFLYPAFAILAAAGFSETGWRKWCGRLAAPVAAIFLVAAYGQALFGLLPLGARDPVARLLGVGFRPVADGLVSAAQRIHAGAVLTTDYEFTAWLRFYEPGLTVIQLGETWRYPNVPAPDAALLKKPLLYFVERKRNRAAEVERYFSSVELATQLRVGRGGGELALYQFYVVSMPKGPVPGRIP